MGSNPRSGGSSAGAAGGASTGKGPRHYSFGRTNYDNINGTKLSGPAHAAAVEAMFGIAPGSLGGGAGGVNAAAKGPPPTATANLPEGVKQTYYTDLTNMPATGGLVRPPVAPAGSGGPMPGAGLNWYVPPPPPRQQFATQIVSSGDNYRRRGGGGKGYGDAR